MLYISEFENCAVANEIDYEICVLEDFNSMFCVLEDKTSSSFSADDGVVGW